MKPASPQQSRISRCLPVVLFAYRRAAHLARCWRSLAANPESRETELHVFLDGAKGPDDQKAAAQTREESGRIQGFRKVHYYPSKTNLGLSRSIKGGITKILTHTEALVVIEEDLELSPFFLRYMNEAVTLYKNHPAVASIHGYVYPALQAIPETFFMKGADCWGWATWSSAWKKFEPNGAKLLEELRSRKLEKDFDLGGVGPFTEILQQQIQGKNDSWAIRWHASAYLAGMHTLYPRCSLVKNIGFDSSGTHCCTSQIYDSELSQTPIRVKPIPVVESEIGRKAFQEFFKAQK